MSEHFCATNPRDSRSRMINSVGLKYSINKISHICDGLSSNASTIHSQFSLLKGNTIDQNFKCSKLTASRALNNHLYFMDFYIEFQRQNFRRVKPLSITDFRFISQIGQGGYGVVYLMATKSGEILAVKKMDKKMLFLQEEIIHIKTERDLMEKSRSEWLVKLHHAFQDDDSIYLAMVTKMLYQ